MVRTAVSCAEDRQVLWLLQYYLHSNNGLFFQVMSFYHRYLYGIRLCCCCMSGFIVRRNKKKQQNTTDTRLRFSLARQDMLLFILFNPVTRKDLVHDAQHVFFDRVLTLPIYKQLFIIDQLYHSCITTQTKQLQCSR